MTNIRQALINAGIKNLKEFGYPAVNAENLLTDYIYSAFFLSMLKDNLGKDAKADAEIKALIAELSKEAK